MDFYGLFQSLISLSFLLKLIFQDVNEVLEKIQFVSDKEYTLILKSVFIKLLYTPNFRGQMA